MLEAFYGRDRLFFWPIERNDDSTENALRAANPAEESELLLEYKVRKDGRNDDR